MRGAVALLEALGADYRMQVLDLKAGANLAPAYLAINPMGKVPVLKHGDRIVTENAAICAYLADAFPDREIIPLPSNAILTGGGSFHCISQQEPA